MGANPILRPLPFGGGNPALWQLKYEVEDERFLQIFSDFSRLIRRSEKAWEEAAKQGNPDYQDFVSETEGEYLEELIGASFLVLQAKIRRVSLAATRLQKFALAQYGITIPDLDREYVIRLEGRYKRRQASLVELVWDVGNYYKHHDEWPHDVWRRETGTAKDRQWKQARKTRRSVERIGITSGSTGNMRTAYEYFDIDPYSGCEHLAQKIQAWASQVYSLAQSRLKAAANVQPVATGRAKN
jgi:hypothetical protein